MIGALRAVYAAGPADMMGAVKSRATGPSVNINHQ
jgi:hypothetical protein